MDFLEIMTIAERDMELINPTTPEKILRVGRLMDLSADTRLIDFGCGYGEPLRLWAQEFGVGGVGIDIREEACRRAEDKMREAGLADRVEIVCGPGADYEFPPHSFDVATCIGASFVWSGYRQALQVLAEAVRPDGRIAIGEPYWRTDQVPPQFLADMPDLHTEHELLDIARGAALAVEGVVRSSEDDWDRYESGNWRGLLQWLQENPDHPERDDVLTHLRRSQDQYFRYGRRYLGWAICILRPAEL